MILIRVNGIEYDQYLSAVVNISFETLANDYSFAATSNSGFPPFKKGDLVEMLVDGIKVCTGFIERIEGQFSEKSHSITYSGRDKTADFIDSNIDVLNDLKDLTLKQLIERMIENIGSSLKVIDKVNPKVFNVAEDIIKCEPGDNCFVKASEFAKKRQVFLTSDGSANIVISNSEPVDTGSLLQNKINSENNNVLSGSWMLSDEDRFNRYSLRSQLDPVGLALVPSPDIATASNQNGGIILDNEVRKGRQFVAIKSKHSSEELKKRAEWTKKMRKVRGSTYRATVQGYRNAKNNLWDVNQLATVDDDFADISRKMLVSDIQFSYSEQGSFTTLDFVEEDAYIIAQQEPRKVGRQLDEFIK